MSSLTKLRMIVELEYDAAAIHGNTHSGVDWFLNSILLNSSPPLLLHSNDLGDQIGEIRVMEILSESDEEGAE